MRRQVAIGVAVGAAAIGAIWLQAYSRDEGPRIAPVPTLAPADHKRGAQDVEHRELVLHALQGSPKAASELINFYDECSGHGHDEGRRAFCAREVDRWLKIGLENGSLAAAQANTMLLLRSKDCADIHRAEYWYNRYRTGGFGDEIMWKSDASEIAEKKRTCSW